MTVIAWDGQMLAGDSMSEYGGLKRARPTKVHSIDGFLVGCAGAEHGIQALLAWFRSGCEYNRWPSVSWVNDVHMLAIDPYGRAYVYWGCWMPCLQSGRVAIGSGYAVAINSMEWGATAKQAVEVAARTTTHCAAPVRFLERGKRRRFPVFDPTQDHRLLKGWLGKKEGS